MFYVNACRVHIIFDMFEYVFICFLDCVEKSLAAFAPPHAKIFPILGRDGNTSNVSDTPPGRTQLANIYRLKSKQLRTPTSLIKNARYVLMPSTLDN